MHQGSSIDVIAKPSGKVSWTIEDPETKSGDDNVGPAAIVSVEVVGHGDGKKFTDEPKLGYSIVKGVTDYIVVMKDKILEHEKCINEIM